MVAKQGINSLFIVGPTASGKSALALKLANKFNAEIICADSQTLRRKLDIGTAKPSKSEQEQVRHHMLDIIDPYKRFSVAQYQKLAMIAIDDCKKRSKLPIIVGGSGLYIDSLFFGYDLKQGMSENRSILESLSVTELQNIIKKEGYDMPKNANNPRHLVGVIARGGNSPVNKQPIKSSLIIGIDRADEELKARIKVRIDEMLHNGLLDEVKSVEADFGKPPSNLDAICYPIISKYLAGEIGLDNAKELIAKADWQYVRKQRAWFKRNPFIQWFTDEDTAFNSILNTLVTS